MGRSHEEWATRFRVPMGFVLGIAYLVFAQPTQTFLEAGGAIALLGLVLRGWAAGCLDKNHNLATSGPYAYTRNPLYLGSMLIGAGFALAGRSWLLGVGALTLFALVYWPVIRREEAFLRQEFGESYYRYATQVPLLFPLRLSAPHQDPPFRWTQYRKNREYEAALGYLAGLVFLTLKMELR
jgi:protein-S-isoprenylcysteine O-methyltransferase Ste14